MDSKVYIVRCEIYYEVEEKLATLIDMMGGIDRFVKPGEKIILKPNLLQAVKPEKAVSTHPLLMAAVGKLVKNGGAKAIIAESPGAGYAYTKQTLRRLYRICGMAEAAEIAKIEMNMDTDYQIVSFPEGILIKRFEILSPVLEADAVFNLCKLKTHTFMAMTGAVKNCFGVIPGRTKPGYHSKLNDTARFAGMLLDLCQFLSPRISIMDAVVSMEGDGPAAGKSRHVGLLIGSKNPLALDVVASAIMNIPIEDNPVLLEARKRNWIPYQMDQVEVIGMKKSDLKIHDFKLPKTIYGGVGFGVLPSFIRHLVGWVLKQGYSMLPEVSEEKCIGCGACRDGCPMHVISLIKGESAKISHRDCIRCYCCHEMCPEDAIQLKGNFLYRLVNR